MLKHEMQDTLTIALDLLEKAAGMARPTKKDRLRLAAFVDESRESLSRGPAGGENPSIIWRLAEVENPRTGRTIVLEVGRAGHLGPADRKRVGGKLDHAPEWVEIRATSRTEARQLIAAGEGTRHRRVKGKVVEVQEKAAASKGA